MGNRITRATYFRGKFMVLHVCCHTEQEYSICTMFYQHTHWTQFQAKPMSVL